MDNRTTDFQSVAQCMRRTGSPSHGSLSGEKVGVVVVIEVISKRMQAFEQSVDSWKADHETAIACMEFEVLVQDAVAVREAVDQLHHRCHQLPPGHEKTQLVIEQAIWDALQAWLTKCDAINQTAIQFERDGFAVARVEEFREFWVDTIQAVEQWRRPTKVRPVMTPETVRIKVPADLPEDWD